MTIQSHFARLTEKAVEDLLKAFDNIPEDKRHWSPMGGARSAIDMIAEIAILNGRSAEVLKTKEFGSIDFDAFRLQKQEIAQDWPKLKSMLDANTKHVAEAIRELPDGDLSVKIEAPWGTMTLTEVLGYPFWNSCYHEGQINYIAAMLGTLP